MPVKALHGDYRPAASVYDELMDANRRVRPHWVRILAGLNSMRDQELAWSFETAERLLRENGVTHNVYGDPQNVARPWRLDPIPLVIGAEEWRMLERGMIQRAKLLNTILADLYGQQRLLKDGLLPAALVFGNPKFLRPAHGLESRDGTYLHLLAVDLARAPDGRWWVLGDRTQAPSGAGYALENRVVMSRSLPELFRQGPVQRLAQFFQSFADNLLRLTRREDPRIVLMSPGPYNDTYFEHAYLARYLGFTLVEGADLTVRDNRVYLKTLDGLKQIDLILRRVDSEYCDPLEFRSDSALGVAGLVGAVRAGHVVVANALGSGVLESDAMMSFFPGLCRKLLGEDLLIPDVATWWCGQAYERDYVLSHLDELVIRPAFSSRSITGQTEDEQLGASMSAAEREAFARKVGLRGYNYIGQEVVSLSTTPIWRDERLHPGPMTLRVFLAADGDSYQIMPGGFTRISDRFDARAISMQKGDASKDTWVIADGPVSTMTRLPSIDSVTQLRRTGRGLPSRAADNLFWLGRYVERTENVVRLFRSLLTRLTGEAGTGIEPAALRGLLDILVGLGHLGARPARRAATHGISAVEREMWTLLFDPDYGNGLAMLLRNLDRIATQVRERLSTDAWRILTELRSYREWSVTLRKGSEVSDALNLLDRMILLQSAFSGMASENMTRNNGWRMLDVGRRLERASHMAKLLRGLAARGHPGTSGILELLLELADSSMTYRVRYTAVPQLAGVVDLLLADDSNPRSVAFQLLTLEQHIAALPGDLDAAALPHEQRIVIGLRNDLRLADMVKWSAAVNARGLRVELDRFLHRTERELNQLSEVIAQKYFSHALPMQNVGAFAAGA